MKDASRRQIVRLIVVALATFLARPAAVFAQEAAPSQKAKAPAPAKEILVGANYFAGWWETRPNKWLDRQGRDWRERFPERVPLLGQYNDQATVDREIVAASQAGIDFFAILWYPIDANKEVEPGARFLNRGLECFLKSPQSHRMKFYVEYCNHPPFCAKNDEEWDNQAKTWIAAMRHPSYLRVGGRLVFKVHSGWGLADQSGDRFAAKRRLERLREAVRKAGLGEMVIGGGVMSQEQVRAGHWAPDLYDFTACYMDVPPLAQKPQDYPFQTLADWTAAARKKHTADTIPYLPYLPAGWNPRPWSDPRAAFALPTRDEWTRTLEQIKEDLKGSRLLGIPLPDGRVQKAFTIYAWNEFGEGGFLAPTRGERSMKLDAIRAVFGRR